jgi:hypothetical protein
MEAGLRIGAAHGYRSSSPVVLQDTNNTVVWLCPHPVVAKIGTRPQSAATLRGEHAVARALARAAAPSSRPIAGAAPADDPATGFTVTLWERLVAADAAPSSADVAHALRDLHEALANFDEPLPSFREGIAHARATLLDDGAMRLLDADGRDTLRCAFDDLLRQLDRRRFAERVLHGEPHDGNLVATADGVRWIDFEAACRGPLEWDLAFVGEEAAASFAEADDSLLALLRNVNSARVATWCWARADHPEMRPHAEHHLEIIRRWRSRPSPAQH